MDPTLSPLSIDPTTYSGSDGGGSNGVDLNSLMTNLIGTAGNAYVAQQTAAQNVAVAQAQAQAASVAASSDPLAVLSTVNPLYLWIGVGLVVLLILRK